MSCLAHALGSMSYSERCVLRLHDVVVTRKALNLALSYYPVVRECVLGVVEKARKPRKEEEKEEKATSAASGALDAMEQLVNSLASGEVEEGGDESAEEEGGEAQGGGGRAGFEEEKKRRGKGRKAVAAAATRTWKTCFCKGLILARCLDVVGECARQRRREA